MLLSDRFAAQQAALAPYS